MNEHSVATTRKPARSTCKPGRALRAARARLEQTGRGPAAEVDRWAVGLASDSETSRAALALDYAPSNLHTFAIRFEPCPPGTPMYGSDGRLRRVTVFPGGFSFLRRGCYDLEVRVEGERVGVVTALTTGAVQDLLHVALDGVEEEALVPFVEEIVPEIDPEAGVLVLTPPPGLLELATGVDEDAADGPAVARPADADAED